MRRRVAGLAVVLVWNLITGSAAQTSGALTETEVAEGWVRLFDGRSLRGWTSNRPDLAWTVEGGVVRAEEGPSGLLVSSARFADFELRFRIRVAAGGNSGVFLRTAFEPKDVLADCYELNVCDPHPTFPTGSLVGRARPEVPVVAGDGWHDYRVLAEGTRILVEIDGRTVLDAEGPADASPRSGHIGLQKNEGRAEFRDVSIRPLGLEPIAWGTIGGEGSLTIGEGGLSIVGTGGAIGSDGVADFLLATEVRREAGHRDGALLVRARTAGDGSLSGYEVRIGPGTGTNPVVGRLSGDPGSSRVLLAAAGDRFTLWVDGDLAGDPAEAAPGEPPAEGAIAFVGGPGAAYAVLEPRFAKIP